MLPQNSNQVITLTNLYDRVLKNAEILMINMCFQCNEKYIILLCIINGTAVPLVHLDKTIDSSFKLSTIWIQPFTI